MYVYTNETSPHLHQRPAQIRQMLQDDHMPVYDAPPDDGHDGGADDGHEAGSPPPRQSYNFAPGYHGVVYRADVPDWGAGPRRQRKGGADDKDAAGDDNAPDPGSAEEVRYKLQTMKWGLVPFWTKRPSDYSSVMKTINCRDDSLAQQGGGSMWASMKARKRCVVVAQGFYEWLHKDRDRDKVPHFVRRRDGRLMCFAGLWDVAVYEGEFLTFLTPVAVFPSSPLYIHPRIHALGNPVLYCARICIDWSGWFVTYNICVLKTKRDSRR